MPQIPQGYVLDYFTVRAADFRASEGRECKEGSTLLWSQAL